MSQYTLWPNKFNAGINAAFDFWEKNSSEIEDLSGRLVILGIGGSGIAGRMVSTIVSRLGCNRVMAVDPCNLPVDLGFSDLAVVVSHSGNTWEILEAVKQLRNRKVRIMAVTGGGYLLDTIQNCDFVLKTPSEGAESREELGRFLGIIFGLINCLKLVDLSLLLKKIPEHIEKVVDAFSCEDIFIDFFKLLGQRTRLHVLGVSGDTQWIAHRCQTQMNENAKLLSVASVLPEVHHNLIEGFGYNADDTMALVFVTDFISKKLQCSVFGFCDVISRRGVKLYRPVVLGDTWEEQMFSLVIWSDFASYYLGLKRGFDVRKVVVIDELRSAIKSVCGGK